jgi:Spy/CpxP family protein refolding chaperone
MHPGMMFWWKRRQECGDEGEFAGCGPDGGYGWHGHGHDHGPGHGFSGFEGGGEGGPFGGGGFGVRRPLRFLAWKLDLSEDQVAELAKILNELKTERAQAAVDSRRTLAAFADAVGGETFDESKVSEAARLRVQSAERLKDAVSRALGRIHALLSPEQRSKLAYLIRTGVVAL